jgi:N-acetylmuramoyl-L-alanine amidase
MWLRPKLNKKTGNGVNALRLLLLTCVLISLTSFTRQRIKGKGITTVVIDAGHGGHDSGCLGSHAKEKDVTLSVALKLGTFITDNFKDVKVIYTRKTDVFIGLDERAAVANNNKADLFISIHCNSGARAAYGVETYVMGLHRTEENLAVSKRENSVVLLEKDYKNKYDGFDPDSPEGNIIFTLYQNAFLDQSLKISTMVQMETSDFAGRFNRGVKQAGFLVLYKTTMPAILIETGFLTNPAEERYMLSKEGQEKLAYSLFRAFSKYKDGTATPALDAESKEPDSNLAADTHTTATPQVQPEKKAPVEAPNTAREPKEEPKKYVVKPPVEKTTAPAESTAVKKDTASGIKTPTAKVPPVAAESTYVKPQKDTAVKVKVVEKAPAITPEIPVAKPQKDSAVIAKAPAPKIKAPVETAPVKSPVADTVAKIKQPQPEITKEVHKPAGTTEELYFTVQIATAGKLLSENSPVFKGEKNIISENVNGFFKYMTGKYTALTEATARQNQLRAAGFPDAFVVAYHNGTRITLKEARMLLEKN